MRKYATARLVVVSSIHCALPCLGVDTPVIFVPSEKLTGNSICSKGRFDGLIELLNVVYWTPNGINPLSESYIEFGENNYKCGIENVPPNPKDFEKYRDNLNERVVEFLND